MSKTYRNILFLPVFILLVGLACNLSGAPTPPRSVPTEAPQEQATAQQLPTLQSNPDTGTLTMTITEAQLTSYIVQNAQQDYGAILSNPVIVFQPGQVELYGTIKSDAISADGRVVMTVNVDPNGEPVVNILEANFGPFPIPSSLLANLSTAVDNSIKDSLNKDQSEYRLESITFSTGVATIVLTKK